MTARRLAILAGAVLLVLITGVVALKLIFTPEKLRAMAEPRLEAALDREVTLESVRLKVFPNIAVRLEGVTVANAPGFGAEPLLQVEALDLQAKLIPLLRRRFELGGVRLLGPALKYEVAADGTSNLAGLGGADESGGGPTEQAAAGQAVAGAFFVSDLAIEGGQIQYRNATNGRRVTLGLEARMNASRPDDSGSRLESEGWIEFENIRARLSSEAADTIAVPEARLEYDMLADLAGDSLVLRQTRLDLAQLPLRAGGVVRELRGERRLDLKVESDPVEVSELLASLPGDRAMSYDLEGDVRLQISVQGPLGGEPGPRIDGKAELSDLAFAHPEMGQLLTGGAGVLAFSLASATLQDFEATLLGRPLRARLEVTDFDNPRLQGRVSGEVDLARVAALRPQPLPMQGTASYELDVAGPLEPRDQLRLRGPIRLADVIYRSGALAEPVQIRQGTIQLTGTGVRAEDLRIQAGSSDLRLDLTSPNALLLALVEDPAKLQPSLEFTATSDRLDWGELAVETEEDKVGYAQLATARLAGRELKGRDPGEIARSKYSLPPIPFTSVQGRVTLREFINPPTQARNISFDLTFRQGILRIENLRGEMYGGAASGSLSLDARDGAAPFPLTYKLALENAQAGAFVSRWTRLGEALTGTMNFSVDGSTDLDASLLPEPAAVNANGRTQFSEGRFLSLGPANALLQRFNIDQQVGRNFQRLGGPFRIEGGSFLVDDWRLAAGDLKGIVNGRAGLGGVLELSLALDVPPAILDKAGLLPGQGPLGDILGQLTSGEGQAVKVSLGIGGTMSDPKLQLDTKALEAALQQRLQGEGRNLLDRLLRGAPKSQTDSLEHF